MTTTGITHGTYGGYKAHRRRGQKACRPCLDAASERQARYREANPDNGTDRQYARARRRALERLRREHDEAFARYLADELAKERSA